METVTRPAPVKAPLRHFLDLDQISAVELRRIVDQAAQWKQTGDRSKPLTDKTLAMVFEKPSTRTRLSFEVAMKQLGGDVVTLTSADSQLSRGETVADTAKVLSRYVDAIMIRTTSVAKLEELAANASVPVINGLTDASHPCQIMADVLTLEEHKGPIAGKIVCWSGDGNNVAVSWIHAAVRFNFELRLASPDANRPPARVLAWAQREGGKVSCVSDPRAAASGADCLVTDTWVSMNTDLKLFRPEAMAPYRVDEKLMACAKRDAIFMHCLPAKRGEEVTAGVIDGPQSVVWDEAENRMHAQKAILAWCLA
ncbi:MAG TPA: ornithine carbamoyltransferase [Stellaceae bacterium]|jgi:ornithine carbamoyltransferase|nr:ornithine carbamoyltransferase [Stellaceae bacterium]